MSAVDEPAGGGALGEPGPDGGGQTSAARLAAYVQGGGVIVPLLTVFLAFLAGGLVILVTGHNPISTYKAIFDGTGLNWLLPWTSSADRPAAALNLQQTLILTVAADPHRPRGRVRVPLRAVQHRRPGPVPHGLVRRGLGGILVRRDGRTSAHVILAVAGRRPRGRALGGHRRPAQGDRRGQRGDLDDHAQLHGDLRRGLPVRARRPAAERRAALGAGLERHRPRREAPRLLGRPRAPGPPHRAVRRARRARRLLGRAQPLDDRLRGPRRRPQPRGGPVRRHERRRATTCS